MENKTLIFNIYHESWGAVSKVLTTNCKTGLIHENILFHIIFSNLGSNQSKLLVQVYKTTYICEYIWIMEISMCLSCQEILKNWNFTKNTPYPPTFHDTRRKCFTVVKGFAHFGKRSLHVNLFMHMTQKRYHTTRHAYCREGQRDCSGTPSSVFWGHN